MIILHFHNHKYNRSDVLSSHGVFFFWVKNRNCVSVHSTIEDPIYQARRNLILIKELKHTQTLPVNEDKWSNWVVCVPCIWEFFSYSVIMPAKMLSKQLNSHNVMEQINIVYRQYVFFLRVILYPFTYISSYYFTK